MGVPTGLHVAAFLGILEQRGVWEPGLPLPPALDASSPEIREGYKKWGLVMASVRVSPNPCELKAEVDGSGCERCCQFPGAQGCESSRGDPQGRVLRGTLPRGLIHFRLLICQHCHPPTPQHVLTAFPMAPRSCTLIIRRAPSLTHANLRLQPELPKEAPRPAVCGNCEASRVRVGNPGGA